MKLTPRSTCPICLSAQLKHFHSFRHLNRHAQMQAYQEGEKKLTPIGECEALAMCVDCHGLFRENVIDNELLFSNYHQRSSDEQEAEVLAALEKEFTTFLDGNEKYTAELDYIISIAPPGAKILDIGSREGVLSRALSERDFDVTIIEPTKAFTSALSKHFGIKAICGFFERHSFPDETFDLITAFNVLHRVDHVDDFIAAAHEQLREGGQLLLCTNNAFTLTHNYITQQHRIFFTPNSVEIMLARTGFKVMDSMSVYWNGIPRLFTLAKKAKEPEPAPMILDSAAALKTGLLRIEYGIFPPFGLRKLHGPLLRLANLFGFKAGIFVRHLDRLLAKVRGL